MIARVAVWKSSALRASCTIGAARRAYRIGRRSKRHTHSRDRHFPPRFRKGPNCSWLLTAAHLDPPLTCYAGRT